MLNKCLVYTCVTNKRDIVPKQKDIKDVTFKCFIDDYESWPVKPAWVCEDLSNIYQDSRYTSRWHKSHPHIHSPEYDYWIWIDAHINCNDNILELIKRLDNYDVLAFNHRRFDDPYQELDILLKHTKIIGHPNRNQITEDQIIQARKILLETGYEKRSGMREATILIMKNNIKVKNFLNNWWKDMLDLGSPKDQIHFDKNIKINQINLGIIEGNVENNAYFNWYPHLGQNEMSYLTNNYSYDQLYNKNKSELLSLLNIPSSKTMYS